METRRRRKRKSEELHELVAKLPKVLRNEVFEHERGDRPHWKLQFNLVVAELRIHQLCALKSEKWCFYTELREGKRIDRRYELESVLDSVTDRKGKLELSFAWFFKTKTPNRVLQQRCQRQVIQASSEKNTECPLTKQLLSFEMSLDQHTQWIERFNWKAVRLFN
jgi:hypothetical protein